MEEFTFYRQKLNKPTPIFSRLNVLFTTLKAKKQNKKL